MKNLRQSEFVNRILVEDAKTGRFFKIRTTFHGQQDTPLSQHAGFCVVNRATVARSMRLLRKRCDASCQHRPSWGDSDRLTWASPS